MKADDLRKMDRTELEESWETLEEKLFHLRFQSVTEEIQNPSEIRHIRRDIARILTVIREKELAQEKAPEEKSPQEKAPEEKSPQEKAPEEKSPQEKAPEEKSPQEKALEEKALEEKAPEEKSQKQAQPEKSEKQ